MKKYTIEDVHAVLTKLAMNGGNCLKTARQVGEDFGIQIHGDTVRKWSQHYFPSRYAQIQHELSEKIDSRITGEVSGLALRGAQIQGKLLDQVEDRLDKEDDVPLKDAAIALRNVSQSHDIHIRQKRLLEDKPTQIAEVRTIEQAISDMVDADILVDVIEEEDV